MDIEKYTSGKVYSFFEWAFRLAVWNLLLLLITFAVMSIPYYTFYKIQDNNTIEIVEIVEDNTLKVIQKNKRETILNDVLLIDDNSYLDYIVEEVSENDIIKYRYIIKMDKFTISYLLEQKYENIIYDELKLYGVLENSFKELIDDNPAKGTIINYNIDKDKSLVLGFENKTLSFGECVETQSTASSVWLVISIVLGLFAFIPCFVTVFSMIKIYGEEKGSNVLVLFFDRLWDNFKSLYKMMLIMIPVIAIFVFSTSYYYTIISNTGYEPVGVWVYVINAFKFAYNFLLVCLIIIVLWLLNLPMSLGYFRMKTKVLFKFTFSMTFKNILYTMIYLFAFLMPILLCIINTIFLPIWFIFGISFPLYICYIVSRSKYRYLVRNLEEIQREMVENTEIYRFTEQEKGDNREIRN